MTRLCIYLTLLTGLTCQASAIGQTRINLDMKSSTLRDVIWELQKQTDFVFVYNTADVENVRVDAISVSQATVEEILDRCFRGVSTLAYEIADDVIVIKRAAERRQQPERQERTLEGTVSNERAQPIAGATVTIQGTHVGTITDGAGNYRLQVPEGNGLVVVYSFLGRETVTVAFTGQARQNVVLKEAANQMDEVVVTGYQRIERRTLTSSVATVDMERLEYVNQPSIDKLLQGQVAGMTVMNTSGAPGSMPQIRIRGTSTISGSVQPLWVVDGMILDDPIDADITDILTNKNLIASGIGGINVDDIESINVLKDAAATALYGTRAANGVIVITTRSGKIGKPQVRYNGSVYMNMRPRFEDAYMMNSKDRIDVNLEMIEKGVFSTPSTGAGVYSNASDFEKLYLDYVDHKISLSQFENKVKELESVNTDWFDHLFRNAITHRHNLDINGGTETVTYYISGSFMDEQAVAKGVGQKTYTGNVKTTVRLLDNLQLEAKLNVSARDNDSFFAIDSWENPYDYAVLANPAHRMYDEEGNYNYLYKNGLKYNYLENSKTQWRESKNFAFTANVALNWDIIKDLRFRSSFSIMKQNTTDIDIATEESYWVRNQKKGYEGYYGPIWADGGWRKDRSVNARSLTLTNQLSYMPVINENHRFDIIFGNEIKTSKSLGVAEETFGYAHNAGHQMVPQYDLMTLLGRALWSEDEYRARSLSFYGVLGYTFMGRYTVSFNWRADGSNGFGLSTNDKFNPVWAVGLNYQMKEESFLKDVDWLTYLTLRGSYGIQGNLPSESYSDVIASYGNSDGINPEIPLKIFGPKNPGLKWEKTKTMNLALEFGLFGRRVSAAFEYYTKDIQDVLGTRGVSLVTGFDKLQVNWASMKNKGWEITLNTINIDNPNFKWTTNFNIARNDNEVVSVQTTPGWNNLTNINRNQYATSAISGYPLEALWSFRYAGLNEKGQATFYNQTYDPTAETNAVVTTGMSNIEGLVYSGTFMPPVQGGFTNTFSYKNVTLQALFVGSFGHVVRLRNLISNTNSGFGYPDPNLNMSKDWASRWREPGDEKHTNIPRLETKPFADEVSYPYPANGAMYDRSDLRTVSGDYIRLQNVSISYDLFSEKLKKAGIHSMRFMIQGNNLHVWHHKRLKGQDPEATNQNYSYAGTTSSKNGVSFNNTFLPLSRSYSFSVSLQF